MKADGAMRMPGGNRQADAEPARQTLTEKELLLLHRDSDDPEAFAAFIEAYKAPVLGYLCRSGVPNGDREDLFQEVFIKIHQSVHRFEAERELHPWVFTIVVNTTRSYYRRSERRAVSIDQAAVQAIASRDPSAERECVGRQTLERLQVEILALPERHREALLLAGVENMAMKDIAIVMAVPVNTIKTWLHRARTRLLERLPKEQP